MRFRAVSEQTSFTQEFVQKHLARSCSATFPPPQFNWDAQARSWVPQLPTQARGATCGAAGAQLVSQHVRLTGGCREREVRGVQARCFWWFVANWCLPRTRVKELGHATLAGVAVLTRAFVVSGCRLLLGTARSQERSARATLCWAKSL